MSDTYTSRLNLRKPEVGILDPTVEWGAKLNNNFDLIDAELVLVAARLEPEHNANGTHKYQVGLSVVVYTNATMPAGGAVGQIIANSDTDEVLRWSTSIGDWVSL